HQADNVQLDGHFLHGLTHVVLHLLAQTVGRQGAGGITGVNTSLLNVLHDTADHNISAVTDGIDIYFDGSIQEVIKQYRAVIGNQHRVTHVAHQFSFVIDDFHGPATQHVRRAHHQRVANLAGRHDAFLVATHSG